MQDFPGNSQKAKRQPDEPKQMERPTIERVTTAETVRRKRGIGRQFKETFIGGSARMAVEYMTMEVVVPAVRDTLAEALQSGIERLIYGDSRPRRGTAAPSYSNVGHVDYTRMSSPARPKPSAQRTLSRQARSRQSFADLVIPSRAEAEDVIDRMFDLLSRFGVVTVADLYEMTGVAGSHVDIKWGWTQLRGAKATRLRTGGYLLDLPEPNPLD